MAERETIEKVKDKQGVLSQIQNFFTLGYGTKEDLREVDRKLRDLYYADLRDMRHVWEDVYLAALNAGLTASSSDFKKVIQVLDRVMEEVRHADYGYAGLMDRKGHIREVELARVFNHDKTLSNDVESLKEAVNKSYSEAEAENWVNMPAEVKKIKGLILAFENKWREREKRFRPLDI
ncbi:MAG: hypothetical protein JSV12_04250 [Candidatus Bathyarchaeota archaeon]|nr:MAG: hypothetical protein JSV12_04250 [Candidatus Bathyarchaeota archaeon]